MKASGFSSVISALAAYSERELISERMRAGLQAARSQDQLSGRSRRINYNDASHSDEGDERPRSLRSESYTEARHDDRNVLYLRQCGTKVKEPDNGSNQRQH